MIGEAVADAKGEPDTTPHEVTVELPIDAHIPHRYIDGDRLRLEAYTKLAAATTEADLSSVKDELEDRYGPVPPEVDGLFEVARLRQQARSAAIEEITAQGKFVRMYPVEMAESQQLWLKRVCKGTQIRPATRTVMVPLPRPQRLGDPPLRDADLVRWVAQLIKDLVARIPGSTS
jgi:transcription-repair coupling factor (superfamily II helicase)